MIHYYKKGFTLIEILVVVTIIGIMATWATWSLKSTTRYYQQKQAAQMLGAAIRSARSAALKSEIDQANIVYYEPEYGVSTRNAFSVFIYRGRVNPEDITETISHDDISDTHEAGYSILIVNDSGFDIPGRVRSPLQVNASFVSLDAIDDLETRQHIINLPEGIVIKYSGSDEVSPGADPSTSILDDLIYFSYDRLGTLNTRMGESDPFDGLNNITHTSLANKSTYLVVMIGASGSDEEDLNYEPIYVDLRTGNLITVDGESDFASINWPTFTNVP